MTIAAHNRLASLNHFFIFFLNYILVTIDNSMCKQKKLDFHRQKKFIRRPFYIDLQKHLKD
jgi:hypothetical protein